MTSLENTGYAWESVCPSCGVGNVGFLMWLTPNKCAGTEELSSQSTSPPVYSPLFQMRLWQQESFRGSAKLEDKEVCSLAGLPFFQPSPKRRSVLDPNTTVPSCWSSECRWNVPNPWHAAPSALLPGVAPSIALSAPAIITLPTEQLRRQLDSWLMTVWRVVGFEGFSVTTKPRAFACSATDLGAWFWLLNLYIMLSVYK